MFVVCRKQKLIYKMLDLNKKLKPFNSDPIKVKKEAICALTFRPVSAAVKWHVISAECEPIPAGSSAISLGIITFNHIKGILTIIRMINTDLNVEIQSCLAKYTHNVQGIGKLKNHQIKLM